MDFPTIPYPPSEKRQQRLEMAVTVEIYETQIAFAIHSGGKQIGHGYMDKKMCQYGEEGPYGLMEMVRCHVAYAVNRLDIEAERMPETAHPHMGVS